MLLVNSCNCIESGGEQETGSYTEWILKECWPGGTGDDTFTYS